MQKKHKLKYIYVFPKASGSCCVGATGCRPWSRWLFLFLLDLYIPQKQPYFSSYAAFLSQTVVQSECTVQACGGSLVEFCVCTFLWPS